MWLFAAIVANYRFLVSACTIHRTIGWTSVGSVVKVTIITHPKQKTKTSCSLFGWWLWKTLVCPSDFSFFVREAVQCDFDGWQSFDLSTFIERVHVIINLIWERFIRRTHVLLQNVAKQSVWLFFFFGCWWRSWDNVWNLLLHVGWLSCHNVYLLYWL